MRQSNTSLIYFVIYLLQLSINNISMHSQPFCLNHDLYHPFRMQVLSQLLNVNLGQHVNARTSWCTFFSHNLMYYTFNSWCFKKLLLEVLDCPSFGSSSLCSELWKIENIRLCFSKNEPLVEDLTWKLSVTDVTFLWILMMKWHEEILNFDVTLVTPSSHPNFSYNAFVHASL